MYHYLKWAALSLFLKRNLRYLLFILIGIVGIYVADAVYQDMAAYSVMTKHTGDISHYLLMKWTAVLFFSLLIVWSIFKLGVRERKKKEKKQMKKGGEFENDPYMKRLEKFKTPRRLRSKTDVLIERKKKRG
ncbi:hypothetical protein [Hydrogenimonas urashimensis]|uniref:hypothetical protein n=1 Tax=Hydrogenimonas urashimensis TaxID=2740515 RepID=UPI001915CAEE|nr:hypothetical protein [Hydrogenimonas urashimensis]